MTIIWELDYYSRPIVDEQGKKIWELLVCEGATRIDCDPASLYRFAQFCPNGEVNSAWLKGALSAAIAEAPNPPTKIRFFRQAMTNMITKACEELDLAVALSRHTPALNHWLAQRYATVYPQAPGYQPGTNPSVVFPVTPPQPLPDALMGEKWQFVSLTTADLSTMGEWAIAFGEAFPLSLVDLAPDTTIPGLLIISTRAVPLAAWMSGLELTAVTVSSSPSDRLLLETGVNDRWLLATLSKPALQQEAQQFETAKRAAQGLHFLAIQANPQTEVFAGFWLLQGINLA